MLLHFKKYFVFSLIKHNNIFLIYIYIYTLKNNKDIFMLGRRKYEIFLETRHHSGMIFAKNIVNLQVT